MCVNCKTCKELKALSKAVKDKCQNLRFPTPYALEIDYLSGTCKYFGQTVVQIYESIAGFY